MSVDDLKEHIRKLTNLANDPAPGCWSWKQQLDNAIEGLYAQYTGKPTDSQPAQPKS